MAIDVVTAGTTPVAESFFSNLKKEWIKKRNYITRAMATVEIDEHIEIETFYNRTRRIAISAGSVWRPLKQVRVGLTDQPVKGREVQDALVSCSQVSQRFSLPNIQS